MRLNLFLAAVCLAIAILLTIGIIRFFFGSDHTPAAYTRQPADEHVRAGDTLRTRLSDNQASVTLLKRQLIVSTILTLLVLIPSLLHGIIPSLIPYWMIDPWLQAILITPVMFYGGYPIHIDGWAAIRRREPNMNSLVSLAAIASYTYSLAVCLFESSLPDSLSDPYFEITGVIITLILFARLGIDTWLPRRPAFPLQARVDTICHILVPIVILISIWTFTLWLIFGTPPAFTRALLMAISVLIIACPVALSWAAPLSASAALEDAQRYEITIHTTSALQQAQHITSVVIADSLVPHLHAVITQLQTRDIGVITVDAHDTDEARATLHARIAAHHTDSPNNTVAFIGDGSEDVRVRNAADLALVVTDHMRDAIPHADVVSRRPDSILLLITLSQAMMHNIQENLIWASLFNAIGIVIAAGILFPFTGWILNPMLAGVALVFSSICVVINASRLRRRQLLS